MFAHICVSDPIDKKTKIIAKNLLITKDIFAKCNKENAKKIIYKGFFFNFKKFN